MDHLHICKTTLQCKTALTSQYWMFFFFFPSFCLFCLFVSLSLCLFVSWSFGLLVFWSFGLLIFWSFGLLVFWSLWGVSSPNRSKIWKSKGLVFTQFCSKFWNSNSDWWRTAQNFREKYLFWIFVKNVLSEAKKPVAGVRQTSNFAQTQIMLC